MIKISKFDESKFDKIFVFGDLHGSYELFIKMLDKINLTKDDLIIILGDSCDRGDGSAKLFLKYKELLANGYSLKHILGNHEVMMDRAYFSQDGQMKSVWLYNGGIDTIESFDTLSSVQKESLLSWLKEWVKAMPHILTSESYIFVHAGYNPRVSLNKQDEEFVLWSREKFWKYGDTGKEIYYGHTPNRDNQIHKRANNVYSMDVGAVFFDKLRILEIKSKEEFIVSL